MNVVLVNPTTGPRKRSDMEEYLGICYLASALRRHGHDVWLLDASLFRWSTSRTARELLRAKDRFQMVGISVHQMAAPHAFRLARILRENGYAGHICLGGHFPSFKYGDVLRHAAEVDAVVVGEGEETLAQLVASLEGGADIRNVLGIAWRKDGEVAFNGPRPLISDLDALPFPARDNLALAPEGSRVAAILSSRGCYGRCSYCSVTHFYRLSPGKVWRGRSPENVVEEMEILARDHKVSEFSFVDDNFVGPGPKGTERARAIADEIVRRGLKVRYSISTRPDQVERDLFNHLKSSGLKGVFIGVESGLQKDLDYYRKGVTTERNRQAVKTISSLGLDCVIGFIPFHRSSTFGDFVENLLFFGELGVPRATADPLCVLVGTEIHRQMAQDGVLFGPFYDPQYRFLDRRIAFLAKLIAVNNRLRLHVGNLKEAVFSSIASRRR